MRLAVAVLVCLNVNDNEFARRYAACLSASVHRSMQDMETTRDESQASREWSKNEVQLIVADYFDMLEAEALDRQYKKSDHRKALAPHLAGRYDGSIEFKHQNISVVLVTHGLPYIEGYKPRGNYQSLLAKEIDAYLDQNPGLLQRIAAAPSLNPSEPQKVVRPNLSTVIVDPPEKITPPKLSEKPWLSSSYLTLSVTGSI
ncbi:MAG: hypothetical protein R3C18_08425 [Planctomycetaceae bacterium]